MNAIDHILRHILRDPMLDRQVLDLAFGDDNQEFFSKFNATSLESQIESKVIRAQLLKDLDLVRGTRTTVRVSTAKKVYRDTESVAYHFTKEALGGLDIVSVYSLFNGLTGMPGEYSPSAVSSPGGMRKANSYTRVLPGNVVLITKKDLIDRDFHLELMLSNDPNLAHIEPAYIPVLSKAAILLTKMLVFNELSLELNEGGLMGGMELGKLSSIVDSFESAAEDYELYLDEDVHVSMFMNDTDSYADHISMQLDPTI